MNLSNAKTIYEQWAPVVGRILLSLGFLMGAAFKIPGTASYAMEVGYAASAGVPFASYAVFLAFIFEAVLGLCLLVGFYTRTAAFVLAVLTFAFALIFHSNFSDPMQMGQFVSHLAMIGGLLYISVYGVHHAAVKKSDLPKGLTRVS